MRGQLTLLKNLEIAAQNVKELKTKPEHPNTLQSRSVPDVNKVVDLPRTTKKKVALTCYRCGKTGHTAPSCSQSFNCMPSVRKAWTFTEGMQESAQESWGSQD